MGFVRIDGDGALPIVGGFAAIVQLRCERDVVHEYSNTTRTRSHRAVISR